MRYFKNLIGATLFAFIVLVITSCKKDITPIKSYDPTEGIVSLIKSENTLMPSKYVFFQFNQFPDNIDTSTLLSIHVFGEFTNDTTGSIINAGNIIINNSQIITSSPDNHYKYTYDQITLPLGKASMGNFIDLQVTGSNCVDSLRKKLYIPKPIFIHNLYKSISIISNNNSYNLSWNPDSQNMFGKVLIQVSYNSQLSLYNNRGNPTSVQDLSYIVSDNGSFVIPAADLKRFPVSSYISISISRASDNTWPTDRSQIEYIAVSRASTAPVLVQN
jgi:hypothetical protein